MEGASARGHSHHTPTGSGDHGEEQTMRADLGDCRAQVTGEVGAGHEDGRKECSGKERSTRTGLGGGGSC